MSNELERRFTASQVEVRASAAEHRTIGGYAAKFNKPSQNLGGFVERIAPTAFNRARGNGWPDALARYNHDDNMLLGTTAARTLRLDVDEVGLLYAVDVPETRADVYELVTRGDVNKSSFAFPRPSKENQEWGLTDQNYPQRTLLEIGLRDVAPCSSAIAAYTDTSTALRSLAETMDAELEEIRTLAAAGELTKLFIRTDNRGAPRQTFGTAALMALKGRQQDPWV
jgi:HK97 family phage prohead protease